MNKKGLILFFFFFCAFAFLPAFLAFALPVPRPHALSWLSLLYYPRSSLLRPLFFGTVSRLELNPSLSK